MMTESKISLTQVIGRPRVTLPTLPEETWSEIIGLTYNAPIDFFSKPRLLGVALPSIPLYKPELPLVSLVCKTWYRLVLPFIYEEIIIDSSVGLRRVTETIIRKRLGHHTARLILRFNVDQSDLGVLYDLLEHLSSVEIILIDRNLLSGGLSTLETLLLRRIFALPKLWLFSSPCCHNFLGLVSTPRCSTLRTVSFPALLPTSQEGKNAQLNQVLQSPSMLPNLSQLYFAYFIELEAIKLNLPHMRRDLQSVTSIILGYNCAESYMEIIQLVSGYLPNLRYISIQTELTDSIMGREWAIDLSPLPPSVHTLGLSFGYDDPSAETFMDFVESLEGIYGSGLEVVRFSEDSWLDIERYRFVKKCIQRVCQANNWKLEVHTSQSRVRWLMLPTICMIYEY
ncbi:hypothetical protein F5880DRAFT_1515629 [Lentinula raphanica]|nr:hypothetical protein F5880DRAFT_1515629 [Lentinula raphanica]